MFVCLADSHLPRCTLSPTFSSSSLGLGGGQIALETARGLVFAVRRGRDLGLRGSKFIVNTFFAYYFLLLTLSEWIRL